MDGSKLVYMANQIARNFGLMHEVDAAMATADHIKSFWDPRMIAGIMSAERSELSPVAARAIEMVYGPIEHQTQATEFAGVNGGDGSDAG